MPINPWILTAIILLIAIALVVFLYFKGNKLQEEQAEQRNKLLEAAQPATLLIIDKKYLPLKDAGLPPAVLEQAPKRARRTQVPVVKAKYGPRTMNFLADESIYDDIPVKASVKAMISGIYITSINNYRNAPVPEPEKKGFMTKIRKKLTNASK